MNKVEQFARFLHKQAEREMERDECRSIPAFEEYRDQWLKKANEILCYLTEANM